MTKKVLKIQILIEFLNDQKSTQNSNFNWIFKWQKSTQNSISPTP
jgi:hypothetical protein